MALVLASAVGLSACGAKATLDQAVTSVGASPDVQIHLTASYDGPDSSVAAILADASVDLLVANPSGAPLAQAGKDVDAEIVVNLGGQALADIREIDGNDYVEIDLDALTGAPGVNVPASEIAAAQLLLGGRWFELPQSLLQSALPTSSADQAAVAKDQTIEREIVKDVVGVIEKTKYTTLANGGFSETGTLASIVAAVRPTLASLAGASTPTATVKGDYTLTLSMSGSAATGASISITAPDQSGVNATVGLSAAITHASEGVTVPSDVTIVTPALLKEIEAGGA
jgi:hypothetical protein